MLNIKDKTVCIVGAKRSGRALGELVLRLGGRAKVTDKGVDPEFGRWAATQGIACEQGGHTREFLSDAEILVLSPGVSIFSEIVQWAHEKKIPVVGEIEFAYQFCIKPIIAITGSNGKTTVSTLISELVKKMGRRSRLCGNVGQPFALFCMDPEIDYFVLEISSFQMESLLAPDSPFRQPTANGKLTFQGFRPRITVLLNFTDNHLDRHKDLQEYFDAKTRIFLNQQKEDFAVTTCNNERIKELAQRLTPRVVFFDTEETKQRMRLKNPNHLAVASVGEILDVPLSKCQELFKEFKGVEHRLELVRTLDGVDYVNDSKATTAEAGRWALSSIEAPIVMICGGRDKNIDFTVLEDIVRQKVKRMVVFGEAKGKLEGIFKQVVSVEQADDLRDAVTRARRSASVGDSVVLSPMCASFDMFKDYEHRGRAFKEIVLHLS